MSCWPAGHLGSGVGQPDLNQYLPSLCLLVRATREVQRMVSSEGLLPAAGGEGGETFQGRPGAGACSMGGRRPQGARGGSWGQRLTYKNVEDPRITWSPQSCAWLV